MTTIRAALAALALAACAPQPSPPQPDSLGQSLFAPEPSAQYPLPRRLSEISGLAIAPDGRLFAHDDERAVIYELNAQNAGAVKAFSLGQPPQRGDFEGIAIAPDATFYLITSTGVIARFREAGDGETARFDAYDTGLGRTCEIEGLAYLAAEESLIIACKRNHARSMRNQVSLFAWRAGAGPARPWLALSAQALARAAGVGVFQPSSVEFDHASGRMLLLSARDGALAEIDRDGAIVAARALHSSHIQAEGMAIGADGALWIADEGGDGRAMIRRYERTP